MHWAERRRAIIISILLAVFAVFVAIPYAIMHYESPTCTDGKENNGEHGIDCGGECALQCPQDIINLNVLWTKVFQVRDGVYDVVSLVENKNYGIGVAKVGYNASLKDASGAVISSKTGETYVGPNDLVVFFAGKMLTGEQKPTSGEMLIDSNLKFTKTPQEPLPLEVVSRSLVNADSKPSLSAVLRNTGTKTLRDVDIATIVSDHEGVPIGVSTTKIAKIDPDETTTIYFTWDLPFNYVAELESCEQPVDVVLALDRSGSMQSDGKNPPQPLTQAKDAARTFVEQLNERDQVGYVSFATEASSPIDEELSSVFSKVARTIGETVIHGDGVQYTNISDALVRAGAELTSGRHDPSAKSVLVLLTDGAPTYPKMEGNAQYPTFAARQSASDLKARDISIYTIGLGDEVNGELLREVASSPEQYYAAASGADLSGIYAEIGKAICKKGPTLIQIISRINNVVQSPAN